MNCNLCNKEDFIEFYNKARFNKKASWIICKNCGLVTNNSVNTKEVLLDNFKEEGKHKFDAGAFDRYLDVAKERVKFVIPHLTKGMKGLEIGCGVGTFMSEIQKEGIQMVGIEPEKTSANIALEHSLAIANCYFEEFNFTQTYDAIFLWHTLEHFEDINKTLEKVYSLLKPNGKVFIIVPNIKRPYAKLSFFFTNTHKYYFSMCTLLSFLWKHGFWEVNISTNNPFGLLYCTATKKELNKDWILRRDNCVNIIFSLYAYHIKYYAKRIANKLGVKHELVKT